MISTLGLRSSLDLLLWDRRQDMCELHRCSEKSRNLLVLLLGRAGPALRSSRDQLEH